jgi:hypothetical protein
MGTQIVKEWTCDLCLTGESFTTSSSRTPVNWICLAVNLEAPDAAWDHPGWKRFHICDNCIDDKFDIGELIQRNPS